MHACCKSCLNCCFINNALRNENNVEDPFLWLCGLGIPLNAMMHILPIECPNVLKLYLFLRIKYYKPKNQTNSGTSCYIHISN